MRCFILAGGFATRLWPLTEKRAKPLLPLAGRPIVSHPLDHIPKDIPITVSTNAAFEDGFHAWKDAEGHEHVEVLIEQTKHDDQKLGALGALAQWITDHKIDDDILVLTGDNYFGFRIEDFLEAHTPNTPMLAAFDINDTEAAKGFGTVILKEDGNEIHAFEEKPKEPKTTLVSTGCSILPKKTLPVLLEYAERNPDNVGGIFEELLEKGHSVHCYTFNDPWFDIGSFGAYLEATKELVGNQQLLADGANCDECDCHGSVVIGAHSNVRNSRLENVVIFDHCDIEDCELSDCIIDNHSKLKGIDLHGKMLREKTTLVRE